MFAHLSLGLTWLFLLFAVLTAEEQGEVMGSHLACGEVLRIKPLVLGQRE